MNKENLKTQENLIGFQKSFVVHKDSLRCLDYMTDEEAGQLFKTIAEFQTTGQKPKNLNDKIGLAWVFFENQFLREKETYFKRVDNPKQAEASRNNGKLGGRPRKPETQENPEKPKETCNKNKNKNKNINKEKNIKKESLGFEENFEIEKVSNLIDSEISKSSNVPKNLDKSPAENLDLAFQPNRYWSWRDDLDYKELLQNFGKHSAQKQGYEAFVDLRDSINSGERTSEKMPQTKVRSVQDLKRRAKLYFESLDPVKRKTNYQLNIGNWIASERFEDDLTVWQEPTPNKPKSIKETWENYEYRDLNYSGNLADHPIFKKGGSYAKI